MQPSIPLQAHSTVHQSATVLTVSMNRSMWHSRPTIIKYMRYRQRINHQPTVLCNLVRSYQRHVQCTRWKSQSNIVQCHQRSKEQHQQRVAILLLLIELQTLKCHDGHCKSATHKHQRPIATEQDACTTATTLLQAQRQCRVQHEERRGQCRSERATTKRDQVLATHSRTRFLMFTTQCSKQPNNTNLLCQTMRHCNVVDV
jgi:hypothetical protein